MLVDLIEQSSKKVAKAIASQGGRNARRNNGQILALENVLKESRELRKTLLSVRIFVICDTTRELSFLICPSRLPSHLSSFLEYQQSIITGIYW